MREYYGEDTEQEEFWAGKGSPLQQANKSGSKTALAGINAKFGAIYENVERQSNLLEPEVQKTLPKIKNLHDKLITSNGRD